MSGNTFGTLFKLTTFGESHGPAIGAIVDGCPAGLELSEADLQLDLNRRRPGQSRYTSPRRESDVVKILSGVFNGKTTGTPIGLLIENEDQRSGDYTEVSQLFRPGHADFTYHHKYKGCRDYRGGGRSSARETAMRVAAGGIAKKILTLFNVKIQACVTQIGSITADQICFETSDENPFFFADPTKIDALDLFFRQLKKDGDSCGAKVHLQATGVPIGLGEPVFDRLDAQLAKALMSINAVKGVEIGAGFEVVSMKGSENNDQMNETGFLSNHAGGVLGGVSSGQPILANVALKPTPSIKERGLTQTITGETTQMQTKGRHDPCVGIRAVPIVEAMTALTLVDFLLINQADITLK